MKKTKIEWSDSTWNPISGCFNDCHYCYARSLANRFAGASETHHNETVGTECQWMTDAEGEIHVLDEHIYDYDRGQNAPYPYGFDPTFHRYRLEEPKNWTKQRNIFVCSMADMFGPWVPDEWIREIVTAVKDAPQHNYLFLTKNPGRYIELIEKGILPGDDNLWYGTTITGPDDPMFYSYGHNTFLSVEPLLHEFRFNEGIRNTAFARWVIIGAETGRRKNKVIPDLKWVDAICQSCDLEGVPVFMKDSLIPIVGEENMRRDFPERLEART